MYGTIHYEYLDGLAINVNKIEWNILLNRDGHVSHLAELVKMAAQDLCYFYWLRYVGFFLQVSKQASRYFGGQQSVRHL